MALAKKSEQVDEYEYWIDLKSAITVKPLYEKERMRGRLEEVFKYCKNPTWPSTSILNQPLGRGSSGNPGRALHRTHRACRIWTVQ